MTRQNAQRRHEKRWCLSIVCTTSFHFIFLTCRLFPAIMRLTLNADAHLINCPRMMALPTSTLSSMTCNVWYKKKFFLALLFISFKPSKFTWFSRLLLKRTKPTFIHSTEPTEKCLRRRFAIYLTFFFFLICVSSHDSREIFQLIYFSNRLFLNKRIIYGCAHGFKQKVSVEWVPKKSRVSS